MLSYLMTSKQQFWIEASFKYPNFYDFKICRDFSYSFVRRKKMKRTIILIILLIAGITFNISDIFAQETKNEQFELLMKPSLMLPEALTLAQNYIKENNIDISKHYLDNIRLLFDSQWMKGKHWIITWRLKILSDGGEIFIFVGIDKKIRIHKGI